MTSKATLTSAEPQTAKRLRPSRKLALTKETVRDLRARDEAAANLKGGRRCDSRASCTNL